MPVILDTTVGGAAANAYCSLAEANTYHAGHPYAAVWDAATDDAKNRALVSATRILDEQWEWEGYVQLATQRLLWPRGGLYYENGWFVPSDVIPEKLKEATAEFARQLLAADRTVDNDVAGQGISQIGVGSVSLAFSGTAKQTKVVPDAVYFMIRTWGRPRSRGDSYAALVRT